MRLELGTPVRCTDKPYGELADVVVDPISKRVTHLVVRPSHQEALETRLVPIELVEADDEASEISLRCTVEDVNGLESVQEYAYLRLGESAANDPNWDVGVQDVLASPYYEGDAALGGYPGYGPDLGLIYDRVPKGEVEIRRSSDVYSADEHHLGEVDGFLVDDEAQITHLILERGHLWGRREVTIPIGAVAKVETDLVTLSLSKDQVGELPSVRVHRHGRPS
jgi:sporulation protein YlmC with PRC-barrel domain